MQKKELNHMLALESIESLHLPSISDQLSSNGSSELKLQNIRAAIVQNPSF